MCLKLSAWLFQSSPKKKARDVRGKSTSATKDRKRIVLGKARAVNVGVRGGKGAFRPRRACKGGRQRAAPTGTASRGKPLRPASSLNRSSNPRRLVAHRYGDDRSPPWAGAENTHWPEPSVMRPDTGTRNAIAGEQSRKCGYRLDSIKRAKKNNKKNVLWGTWSTVVLKIEIGNLDTWGVSFFLFFWDKTKTDFDSLILRLFHLFQDWMFK